VVTNARTDRPLKIIILDGPACALSQKELRARICAALAPVIPPVQPEPPPHRHQPPAPQPAAADEPAPRRRRLLHFHDIVLDLDNSLAYRRRTNLNLTRLEFDLLEYLIRNSDRYISPAELAENVWDIRSLRRSNMIENRIHNLRRKLVLAGGTNPIVNRRGFGYAVQPPAPVRSRKR